ncbi:MAG TPA: nucleotidyltransferase family protein [Gemmataceae bacterium]|jgi:molybdenum cofactor cytidylyltransferase
MRFAVLPAAGKSVRMGRPKLALPLGERTILEQVIAVLHQAQIEHVLVVVGPHVPELVGLAVGAGANVCRLAEQTADMRATVEHGLNWLEEQFRPHPHDAWLLVPADHPTLVPSTIQELERVRLAESGRSIFVPTWEGRRGHPIVLAWKHVEGIRRHPPGEGLNGYVRRHAAETIKVPVADPDILCDLDTPEEYERLRRRWQG